MLETFKASAAGMAACLLFAACGGPRLETGPVVTTRESIELDDADLVRVEVAMGAGSLNIRGGADNLMDADFTYDVPEWEPEVEYSSTGTRSDLRISQPRMAGSPFGDYEYDWEIALNDNVRMDVIARMGAGEARMDLGTMRLRNVDIDIGVGEVELDLTGGDLQESFDVQIEGGVGEATVYLPNNVAISATASGGLGDIEVQGLEERNGRYYNPGQESNPVMIRVDVRGGVGEIHLIAR